MPEETATGLLQVTHEVDGPRRRVILQGELDLATVPDAAAAMAEAIAADGGGGVILDLSRLEFLDVRGARLVAACRAEAEREGRELAVAVAPGPVARCLGLCGMLAGPGILWQRERDRSGASPSG
jgi:anti-anti-sigma factor